jgi:hypothetical protein
LLGQQFWFRALGLLALCFPNLTYGVSQICDAVSSFYY